VKLLTRFLAVALACVFSAAFAASDPADFLKLWGVSNAPDTLSGWSLLNDGDIPGADAAFILALKNNPKDPAALMGTAQLAVAHNDFQRALELDCKAIESGGSYPMAELAIEDAYGLLQFCKDPAPFANLLNAKLPLSENVRDALLVASVDWQLLRGQYADAIKTAATLRYIDKWMLIGPFDNRDKAGFDQLYEPEKEIDFEKSCEGRNRRVNWFSLGARAADGRIWLSEIFEPRIHVVAYAATLVKSDLDTTTSLHAGCAGALRVWVNGKEVKAVKEYNDFGREKIAALIDLRKGWNLILVKSAVVEETQWGFSLRLGHRNEDHMSFDNSTKALAEWKADKTPFPQTAADMGWDDGLVPRLQRMLAKNPDDVFMLGALAAMMENRRLAEKNNSSTDAVSPEKLLRKAIAAAPKNPLLKITLAIISDDSNEARQAAEAAYKTHPDLPIVLETLAYLAHENHTHIAAEDYARKAVARTGAEKSGLAALVLADEISGLDRSFNPANASSNGSSGKSERAEGWRILSKFTASHPYMADAWLRRIDLEASRTLRSESVETALKYCGGNTRLRQLHIDELARLSKDLEAARYSAEPLTPMPFDMTSTLAAANEFRRAADPTESARILNSALDWAPENPDLLAALAVQQHRAAKPVEAATLLKKALTIKSNAPQLKDYLALLAAGKDIDLQFFAPYDIALAELTLPKPNQFPKENAVKILNQEVVRVNPNGSTSRMVHIIAKVLRPAGAQEVRDHYIYYEPQRQTVDVLRAAVITPDGRELARASIQDRSTSAAMGVQTLIYDEHHLKHVSFNDLEPGSIIDLQYTIRDSGDNIYGDYFADSFYFSDGEPVMRAQYVIDYPKNLALQSHALNSDVASEHVQSKDESRETMKWEMKDIAGVEREHAMPPIVNALPQLQVTTMKNWQEVGQWFWNLAKDQVVVNDDMRRDIAELCKDCKTDTDRLRVVHDWVIRKIRYLGIEFGRNGYKPHRATESYKALYGDCKDTATLLTAMLKAINIDSKLVLIRTVDSGAVPPDHLPMPNIFNHCIAYIPNVDGKDYWIDGTTDFFRLGEVPSADRGAQVLVAGPEGGTFMKIPQSKGEENRIDQVFSAKVASNGSASLTIHDIRSGQFAPMLRESIETPGKFQSNMKDYAAQRFNGAEVKKLSASEPLSQGPAWSDMELSVPNLAARSGDRLALPAIFEPINLTRRYAVDSTRKHDIELYVPWSRKTEINYHFDQGMKIASTPEEASIDEPYGKYSRTVKKNGDDLIIGEVFELPKTRITVKEYEGFKNFCNRVDALMEQKVLLQAN